MIGAQNKTAFFMAFPSRQPPPHRAEAHGGTALPSRCSFPTRLDCNRAHHFSSQDISLSQSSTDRIRHSEAELP